jgi:Putative adhesin
MPTFATPEPVHAIVRVGSGHVRIIASDRVDTVVEVTPGDVAREADLEAVAQTRVDFTDGTLLVRGPRDNVLRWFGLGRQPVVEVTVLLPSRSRVEVTAMADIHCAGVLGKTVLSSGDGDVWVERAEQSRIDAANGHIAVGQVDGRAEAVSAHGDVRVAAVGGSLVGKTANGSVTVGEAGGDLRLSTAHGAITVDRAHTDVTARTADGEIRVGEVRGGTIVLESGNGEVEIGVAGGTAAWLDVSSDYGEVRSALEAAQAPSATERTVEIRARTGYGDILIHRS